MSGIIIKSEFKTALLRYHNAVAYQFEEGHPEKGHISAMEKEDQLWKWLCDTYNTVLQENIQLKKDERRIGFINITFEQYNALIKQVEESAQKVYALTEGFIEAQKTYRAALKKLTPYSEFGFCEFCGLCASDGHESDCDYVQLTKEEST